MEQYSKSTIEDHEGIYYVKLNEGSYYENGVAYGNLLNRVNYPIVKILRIPLLVLFFNFVALFFRHNYKEIVIPEYYLQELRGYADGACVNYNVLLFLNFHFDLIKKFGFFCTTFAFFGKGNRLTVGRNTDMKSGTSAFFLKYGKTILVKENIRGKNTINHLSLPFFIGVVNGFNDNLIVNVHKVLTNDDKFVGKRFGIGLLPRYILENTKDISKVRRIVENNMTVRSMNLMVTDYKNKFSKVIEINPNVLNEIVMDKKSPWFGCTAHFESEKMEKLHTKIFEASRIRLRSLQSLIKKVKVMDLSKAIKILSDRSNGMQRRESGFSITNTATYQSFIIEFDKKIIHISNGSKVPASLTGKFVKISF